MQDFFDQAKRVSKETFEDFQASKGIYRGCRSYANVVAKGGPRNGALLPVGKWARAVICECIEKVQDWVHVGKVITRMMDTKEMVSVTPISAYKGCFVVDSVRRAKWYQEQGSLLVGGRSILLRRWSPRENIVVFGKFRRGWLELKGLPFHLWDEVQLKYILKKWERVTKVARDSLKLIDLSKVKLWVEMLPNVVLPTLLEVEDGAWSFTITVSVTREDEEDNLFRSEPTRSRDELMPAGGCISQRPKNAEGLCGNTRDNECCSKRLLPRSHYRYSSSNLASKRENGWGGSLLGPSEGNNNGPTKPKALFKARFVRAQIGVKSLGPPASPIFIQAHETVALLSSAL